jgi:lipopolysaccharide transport system ATP-binding protein
MSDIAIRVDNLGKRYRLGQRKRSNSLRESLASALRAPWRRARGAGDGGEDGKGTFWALKDVSFEVRPGEVVGIIGRNGAGKSTLLKVLSRITEPTTGEVEITGRVGSLLEVGTGFHPELTGRENVFLNGAILGMRREEIARKFDEIVAFAEVERFIDTPVKHYSSGMYMRLAFAVAAHLEPEILVVDEVLAVGDTVFQQKCLGKMDDVARAGRTVLFVSHNLAALQNLCTSAILLESGELTAAGEAQQTIQLYLDGLAAGTADDDLSVLPREHGLQPVITRLEFLDEAGQTTNAVPAGSAVTIRIFYRHSEPLLYPYFGLTLETHSGIRLLWFQTRLQEPGFPDSLPAEGSVTCHIPNLPLVPGVYFAMPGCGSGTSQLDLLPRASRIEVVARDVFGTGRLPTSTQALVLINATWSAGARGMVGESR